MNLLITDTIFYGFYLSLLYHKQQSIKNIDIMVECRWDTVVDIVVNIQFRYCCRRRYRYMMR